MRGEPKPIWKIFNQSGTSLQIPVYQRNYDWGLSQCERLIDDLEALARSDRDSHPKHFFGSVVGRPEGSWLWIVIDGQQRLTTISILMVAIIHAVRSNELQLGETAHAENSLVESLQSYLLVDNNPHRLKFKLKPVKDDARAYEALFGPEEDFVASSNVTANYYYIRQRLADSELTANELWDAITRLEVMHLDLEPHDDPQRIFESLNSTGLNLSEADKIRNLVLMNQSSADQTILYENRWNPIEQNVDYRTDWFIRWYLTAKTNNTPKESEVFEAFKKYLQRSSHSVPEVLDEMLDFSRNSRAITHAETGFAAVDQRLKRANLIIGDVVHPFLMPVVADAKSGIISEADLNDVVRIIESYVFRRLICQVAANALNKIFATAYSEIRKLRTASQTYAEILIWILRRRDGGSGRFPTDADFRASFETRDCYHLRPGQRQYLFDVLENGNSKDNRDIARQIESGDLSVEHIMPQTLTASWRVELGPNAEEIHDIWQHRIGNLTVTGYNSSYSNSSFQSKKEMDFGFNSSPYRLNHDVKIVEHWTEDAMRTRSARLTKLAVDYWSYVETDYRPPEVVRPTEPMGVDTSFRNREVTAYAFGDISETVSDWANLVPKVLKVLLQQHRSELLKFAETESQLSTSPDDHKERRGFRRVEPGLGVWVTRNTNAKLAMLRRVFEALGLDPEDLIFTLRPPKGDLDAGDISHGEEANRANVEAGPFSDLTKFRDAVDEAAELKPDLEGTADLRIEFAREFVHFRKDDWQELLGGKQVLAYCETTSVEDMTSDQILAVVSGLFAMEKIFDPAALHHAIVRGELSAWLHRLESQ